MRKNSFRFGLFRLDYAILDSLTVKTYWAPWLLLVPNAQVKWRFAGEDPFSMSFDAGVFYLDTKLLTYLDQDLVDARLVTIPMELAGSYRFHDQHSAHATVIYTPIYLDGRVDTETAGGILSGATQNLQTSATYELRLNRVTAFQFTGRLVLYQGAHGESSSVYQQDEYTTIEIFGSGAFENAEIAGKGSFVADAVFSWNTWNLRAGLGYGHYNLPGFNFVTADPGPIFSFDLYWVWD
jgi:hypothetical protein